MTVHRAFWRLALLLAAVLGVGLLAPAQSRADITMSPIFSDHMVLQRDLANRVWGWAQPGEEIAVVIAGQTKKSKAGDDGAWEVKLDPMPAGGPHQLVVEGSSRLEFGDVLVGEVWVCSGQSNMQWPLSAAYDADLEAMSADFNQIRLISVPQVGTQDPQKSFDGSWQVCTPEAAAGFSAIGFLYGRILHEALDVPIGLIDDAWGGSACEAWIRRDLLEKDPQFAPLIERWNTMEAEFEKLASASDLTEQQQRRKRELEGQMRGNQRPSNIYNGVLKPTIGYGIRGAIWYQGESNAGRAYQYRELFPLMIQSWREEWGIGDFPFFWVQLADFMAEKPEPGDSGWAELREAQTMTMDRLPSTGQAVIIDIGEGKDIHPKNKLGVARRLARWALATVYGKDIVHRSPQYASMEKKDGSIVLHFNHVPTELITFDVPELRGFTIAGSDHTFVPAEAKIVDKNTIVVSAPGVSDPVAVRYAWADNPICNVYSKEGLPLTPFRTDDWPGVTADSK